MARGTKLTDELKAAITRDLAAGLPRTAAVARAGISYPTFVAWMRKQAEPYLSFSASVKRAEADARNVAVVQRAATESWQAAAWWLERKYPEDWAANRRELTELRKQLADLETLLASRVHLPPAPPPARPAPGRRHKPTAGR